MDQIVNPLTSEEGIRSLIKKTDQEMHHAQDLSKMTHVCLIVLGLGSLIHFGTANPIYVIPIGILLTVAYGPACGASVEKWNDMAKAAKIKSQYYQEILTKLKSEVKQVPDLNQNKVLIVQWHLLEPLPETSFPTSSAILTPKDGKDAFQAKKKYFESKMENYKRKIHRAYLIHIAQNSKDTREVAKFITLNEWKIKHLDPCVPFAFFNKVLNTTIEEKTPKELAALIFTLE